MVIQRRVDSSSSGVVLGRHSSRRSVASRVREVTRNVCYCHTLTAMQQQQQQQQDMYTTESLWPAGQQQEFSENTVLPRDTYSTDIPHTLLTSTISKKASK